MRIFCILKISIDEVNQINFEYNFSFNFSLLTSLKGDRSRSLDYY